VSERVLVTGAVGFIGGHTCRALLQEGREVVGLDNFDPFYDRRIKEGALAKLREERGFSFAEGDIRDESLLCELLDGVDVVVHLAARAGVRPSIEDPGLYASVNVEGTVRLLEACRSRDVRRFVFGSSSSVYGDTSEPPFREDAPALDPVSPYAATKRAGELLCQVYHHLFGMRIASLRFFTVYGPRQRPDLAIHRFTRLLAEGTPIQQFGDGSSERDYTHIDDILKGVSGAVSWTADDEPAHEVFNLGESRTVRLDHLIRLISDALGVAPEIEYLPMQPGDVQRTHADISKARAVLGYDPQVAIEDGITRFVTWYEDTYGLEPRATA
jgi:UDP-glucuronate 4-epimerase